MRPKAKSPQTYGNLAQNHDPVRSPAATSTRPLLRLIPGFRDEAYPLEHRVLRPEQLVLGITISIIFCLLWVLIVFVLFRIARTALGFSVG